MISIWPSIPLVIYLLCLLDSGDIFTPENVQTMCEVEQVFFQGDEYKKFCVLGTENNSTERTCLEQKFTIGYNFYGTVKNQTCNLLNSSVVQSTAQKLYNDLNIPSRRGTAAFFMDSNTEKRTPVSTSRTRSRIDLGAPLEGYVSAAEEQSEQQQDYMEHYLDVKDEYFEAFNMKSRWLFSAYRDRQTRNGITVKWYSQPLVDIETGEIANGDILLAIFSLVFVYVWMLVQMKSIFLGTFCMLQVLFSLPLAIVVYRSVFQIPYFQFIHILVIFLVLGIGADDVFVMSDGWKFSADAVEIKEMEALGASEDEIVEKRMEISFTNTIGAIWTTSFTTIVSFLATSISPIMPISTFGLLAATAILLNFFLVISLVPAILVTYHYWFVKKRFFIYNLMHQGAESENPSPKEEKKGAEEKNTLEMVAISSGGAKMEHSHQLKSQSMTMGDEKQVSHGNAGQPEEKKEDDKDILETFVEKIYTPAMTFRSGRCYPIAIVLVCTFLAFGLIGLGFSTQIQPPDESAQFLPEDNMLVEVPEELSDDYIPSEFSQYAQLFFAFGIDRFDRGGFNRFEPGKNRGEVKFLDGFQFHLEPSQRLFNYSCERAKVFSCNEDACEGGRLMFQDMDAIKCFLPSFQTWFMNRNNISTYNATESLFYSELLTYRSTDTEDIDDLTVSDKLALIGFVGNTLRYVRFDFYTTIKDDRPTVEKAEARKVADDLADDINAYKNQIGATTMGDTAAASSTWVQVEAELGIVAGFYSGLAISFPVAFIVLLVTTHNLIIALLAIFTIGFIVVCVISTIVWQGDTLGIAEAIAGVIVIGFSVDYVIHLGHSYIDAYHGYGISDRAERFNHASVGMAATVIAGGVTTFGAALPLLATQHRFFPTMGALMASTVAFSLTFSLMFFMGCLVLFGPNGDVGDLSWIAEKLRLRECLEKIGVMDCLRKIGLVKATDTKQHAGDTGAKKGALPSV